MGRRKTCGVCWGAQEASPGTAGRDPEWGRTAHTRISVCPTRGHIQLNHGELILAPRPLCMSLEVRDLVPSPSVCSVSMTRCSPWPQGGEAPSPQEPQSLPGCPPMGGRRGGRETCICMSKTLHDVEGA